MIIPEIVSIAAATVSLTFLLIGIWGVISYRGGTWSLLLIIHFVFYGLPLYLDVYLGEKDVQRFPGYFISQDDPETRLLYAMAVSIAPIIIFLYGRARPLVFGQEGLWKGSRGRNSALFLLSVSPLLLVLASPQPSLYAHYGIVHNPAFGGAASSYHGIVAVAVKLALFSLAILGLRRGRLSLSFVMFALVDLMAVTWVDGKRFSVAFALILLLYVVWRRRVFSSVTLAVLGIVGVLFLGAFSFAYQATLRGVGSEASGTSTYLNMRIDYGRDAQLKLALYAEMHPDKVQILQYRGQSLVFVATAPIPRAVWTVKPMPYAQYMTSALFLASPRFWGWGMTTSWLDESVANFGVVGILFGPFLLAWAARWGDANRVEAVRVLTFVNCCLLLTLHIPAFYPLFGLWIMASVGSTIVGHGGLLTRVLSPRVTAITTMGRAQPRFESRRSVGSLSPTTREVVS